MYNRERKQLWMQEKLNLAATFLPHPRNLILGVRTSSSHRLLKATNPKQLVPLVLVVPPATLFRSRTRGRLKFPKTEHPRRPGTVLPYLRLLITRQQGPRQQVLRQRRRRSRARWMLNRRRQMKYAKNCSPMRSREWLFPEKNVCHGLVCHYITILLYLAYIGQPFGLF